MSNTLLDPPVESSIVARPREAISMLDLESYRSGLTGYCYRMLGSAFDAEDAVQETMVRAWRSLEGLNNNGSVKAWVYRITTNVCFDALRGRQRRVLPMELSAPCDRPNNPGSTRLRGRWIGPVPDQMALPTELDPAEVAVSHESIRLAFIAALQHLPPRQRAVFILREVLQWSASEVAGLLNMTVIAVNSALQRSRATIATARREQPLQPDHDSERDRVLDAYVDAFQQFDLDRLASLLHLEATLSMAPFDRWLRGPDQFRYWYQGPASGCQGSLLCPIAANGSPAFAQYRPGGKPWAVHVLELSDGKIAAINCFLDAERLFPLFGLPLEGIAAKSEAPVKRRDLRSRGFKPSTTGRRSRDGSMRP
jgi:RNA polymerase sigma-70 factor (ECF subfamily)